MTPKRRFSKSSLLNHVFTTYLAQRYSSATSLNEKLQRSIRAPSFFFFFLRGEIGYSPVTIPSKFPMRWSKDTIFQHGWRKMEQPDRYQANQFDARQSRASSPFSAEERYFWVILLGNIFKGFRGKPSSFPKVSEKLAFFILQNAERTSLISTFSVL